jgi:hypothetical protein
VIPPTLKNRQDTWHSRHWLMPALPCPAGLGKTTASWFFSLASQLTPSRVFQKNPTWNWCGLGPEVAFVCYWKLVFVLGSNVIVISVCTLFASLELCWWSWLHSFSTG